MGGAQMNIPSITGANVFFSSEKYDGLIQHEYLTNIINHRHFSTYHKYLVVFTRFIKP